MRGKTASERVCCTTGSRFKNNSNKQNENKAHFRSLIPSSRSLNSQTGSDHSVFAERLQRQLLKRFFHPQASQGSLLLLLLRNVEEMLHTSHSQSPGTEPPFLCFMRASCSSVPWLLTLPQPQCVSQAATSEALSSHLTSFLLFGSSRHKHRHSFFLATPDILYFISLHNFSLFLIAELLDSWSLLDF